MSTVYLQLSSSKTHQRKSLHRALSAGLSFQIEIISMNPSPSLWLFWPFFRSVCWDSVTNRVCQRTAPRVRMDVVCVNRDHLSCSAVADNGGSRTNGGILVFVISYRVACELPFSPSWLPAFPLPPGEPRSAFMTACQSHRTRGGKSPSQSGAPAPPRPHPYLPWYLPSPPQCTARLHYRPL